MMETRKSIEHELDEIIDEMAREAAEDIHPRVAAVVLRYQEAITEDLLEEARTRILGFAGSQP